MEKSDENSGSLKAPSAIEHLVAQGGAILAPMSGVTDIAMRRIAERFGASLVVSEMVASNAFAQGEAQARLRAEGAGLRTHVVQLAGCVAQDMAQAAKVAQAAGAAIIDINMGCPAKRVVGGWAGSALMRDLDHAQRLIEATVGAVSIPVTLKMRLGWDDATLNAPLLAQRAEAAGIRMITVHGRTRQQFYKGTANWNAVEAVVGATRLPVIVNGDIADMASAQTALKRSGAKAVMIGRAALGRPWIVGRIARGLQGLEPKAESSLIHAQAALEHYEGLLSLYGRKIGLRHARKHLAAYADHAAAEGAGLVEAERAELVTSEEPERVARLLESAFLDRGLHPAQQRLVA